jgi:hypothetical protein
VSGGSGILEGHRKVRFASSKHPTTTIAIKDKFNKTLSAPGQRRSHHDTIHELGTYTEREDSEMTV